MRSIDDPVKALAHFVELFSVQEFLACCSVSVPELERSWARQNGVPASQTKESFKRFLGSGPQRPDYPPRCSPKFGQDRRARPDEKHIRS
jgi:hypothetical protein